MNQLTAHDRPTWLRTVTDLAHAAALLIAVAALLLLVLEWSQLTVASRLVCAATATAVATWSTIRHARHHDHR